VKTDETNGDDGDGDRLIRIAKGIAKRARKLWPNYLRCYYDEAYSEAMVSVAIAYRRKVLGDRNNRRWRDDEIARFAWGYLVSALRSQRYIPRTTGDYLLLLNNQDDGWDNRSLDGGHDIIDQIDEIGIRLRKGEIDWCHAEEAIDILRTRLEKWTGKKS